MVAVSASTFLMPTNADIVVGRIGRAHGLRGEVGVEVRTDVPEIRFAAGSAVFLEDGRSLTVESSRPHGRVLLVRFEGVGDRTAAETLRGQLLLVEAGAVDVPTEPDTFFDHQLVGLEVRDPQAKVLGSVSEVVHLPGQDLLAVQLAGDGEALVPFVSEIVTDVDLAGGVITVDAPEGLLDPQGPGA